MSEMFFENSCEAESFLVELKHEMEAVLPNWDRNNFFGMYICHDVKVMWFVRVTEEAVRWLDTEAIKRMDGVGQTMCEYLAGLVHLLSLATIREAGEHASDVEKDWRLNSMIMVGGLHLAVREKWSI